MEDYDKRLQTIQRHFWKKFIEGRDYKEQKASTMKLLYTDRPNRETARQTLPPLPLPWPLPSFLRSFWLDPELALTNADAGADVVGPSRFGFCGFGGSSIGAVVVLISKRNK